MKERKNFKCSYEVLSCFKCFMNCLPFFKKKGMEGIIISCSFWTFLSKERHIECVKVLSTFDISYRVLKTITIGHKVLTSPNQRSLIIHNFGTIILCGSGSHTSYHSSCNQKLKQRRSIVMYFIAKPNTICQWSRTCLET